MRRRCCPPRAVCRPAARSVRSPARSRRRRASVRDADGRPADGRSTRSASGPWVRSSDWSCLVEQRMLERAEVDVQRCRGSGVQRRRGAAPSTSAPSRLTKTTRFAARQPVTLKLIWARWPHSRGAWGSVSGPLARSPTPACVMRGGWADGSGVAMHVMSRPDGRVLRRDWLPCGRDVGSCAVGDRVAATGLGGA